MKKKNNAYTWKINSEVCTAFYMRWMSVGCMLYNKIYGLGSISPRFLNVRQKPLVYLFLFFILSKAEHNFSIKVVCHRIFLGVSFWLDLSPHTLITTTVITPPPTSTTHTCKHKFLHSGWRIIILRPTHNTDPPNYTCLPTLTFIISISQTFPVRRVRLLYALTVSLKTDLYFCFPRRSSLHMPGYQPHTSPLSHHSLSLFHSYVSVYNIII